MRTLTAAQSNALALSNRSTHVRVRVDGGSGFVDLRDLEGRDWIESVEYSGGVDTNTVTASVRLKRQVYELSLATLVDGSKINANGTLIDAANPIVIDAAVVAHDAEPAASEWVEVFRGEIDDVDWSGVFVVVRCTDQGGALIRTFIETQRVYGATGGEAVENVMQDILDDNNVDVVRIDASLSWNGTTTITAADTSEVVTGDFVAFFGTGSASAVFFEISSIVPNTSITITNPSGRTIPTGVGVGLSSKLAAADRVTLYSVNGTGGTPFLGGDSPGFDIVPYVQQKETVMDALSRLAQLIGWRVRYLWQGNTAAFQLVFSGPERSIAARGTATFSANPGTSQTITIDGNAIESRTVLSSPSTNQFLIGADATETAENLATALNATSESGVGGPFDGADDLFAFKDPDADAVIIVWGTQGTVGNAVTFTESMANLTIDGGGFLGGTVAGADGKTSPDRTFSEDQIINYQRLRVSRQDIRNVVKIGFRDINSAHFAVTRKDEASIAKFGRMYMEITEGLSSQIDTLSEATSFADAAIADLSTPDAEQDTEIPFFWPIEDADLIRFTANGDHYDTDQDLSVVSWRHSLRGNMGRTSFESRGKPSGGFARWLAVQGRPGIAPALDLRTDNAIESGATSPGVGSIVFTYDDPQAMSPPIADWAVTRFHAVDEDDAGFPSFTASAANKVGEARSTRFEIGGLIPGKQYAVRGIIVDAAGNESTTATQVTQATERVGPYHENTDGQQDQLCRNADFNVFTKGVTVPPDFWTEREGVWQTDLDENTDSATGGFSIDHFATASLDPRLKSEFIPIGGGSADAADILQLGAIAKNVGGVVGQVQIRLRLAFFDSSKVFISNAETVATFAGTDWESFQSDPFIAPTTARFVQVLPQPTATVAQTWTMRLDRVGLLRSYANGHIQGSSTTAFATSFVELDWLKTGADEAADHLGVNQLDEIAPFTTYETFGVVYPGIYMATARAFFDRGAASGAYDGQMRIQADEGAGFVTIASGTGKSVTGGPFGAFERMTLQATSNPVLLSSGDRVRVSALTNSTAGSGTITLTDFHLRQVVRIDQ